MRGGEMTKEEMAVELKSRGLTKAYKVAWDTADDERGIIRFLTRKPVTITDGVMRGTEFTLSDGVIRVWTSRTKKAVDFSKTHGLKANKLTGECEFWAPASLGDTFLHAWGAKVAKTMTAEQRNAIRERFKSSILVPQARQKQGLQ